MTASVRIEGEAYTDLRFVTLARLMGFADSDHALVKTSRIWAWQTEHYTPDAPTYVVDPDIAEAALGIGGAAALVRAKLAEEVPEGLRMCGTVGRIEWRWALKTKGQRGGAATKRKWADKTGPGALAGAESDGSAQPSPPSPTHSLPEISLPRAIPPSTEQAPVPAAPATARPASGSGDTEPANQPTREDRKAVRDAIRAEINAARARVGAKLGTPLHPVLPFDRGLDSDLSGQLSLATTRADLEALATQARHAVAMAELEALAEPERVQFLTGAIFSGGNFARLAGKTAATARAGPKRGAARAEQPTIRPKTTDDEPPIPSWE